jgi:acetylornithine/N-succinyldiaminopimelate aminotransferase
LPDVYFIEHNNINNLQLITEKTACVIIEVIQGDAGVRIPSQAWMDALRQRCTETGAMLIFDEIQSGMGRTGAFFAFEHFGVHPDILTIGKAVAGGLPMGIMISRREWMQLFTHNPMLGHITTFGGNPLICAAAAACLEVLKTEIDFREVEAKGKYLEEKLKHPLVREIRRKGLMFAIDLDHYERVKKVVDYCLDKGVITFWFLSTDYAFRLAPPLNISYSEIDTAAKIIQDGFAFAQSE